MRAEDGVTLRELLMEVRADVKEMKEKLPHYVTWRQMFGAMSAAAGLILAVIRLT